MFVSQSLLSVAHRPAGSNKNRTRQKGIHTVVAVPHQQDSAPRPTAVTPQTARSTFESASVLTLRRVWTLAKLETDAVLTAARLYRVLQIGHKSRSELGFSSSICSGRATVMQIAP